jgi:hypothetical protein
MPVTSGLVQQLSVPLTPQSVRPTPETAHEGLTHTPPLHAVPPMHGVSVCA